MQENRINMSADDCFTAPQAHRVLLLAQNLQREARPEKPLLLAIDGRCGSGKSSLAAFLAGKTGCPVFHMDDFYLPFEQRTPQRMAQPGGNIDTKRLIQEVLEPFAAGREIVLRPFDCASASYAPPVTQAAVPFAIMEGSYSLLECLRGWYAASVFVTCPAKEQHRRLLLREGTQRIGMFEERWIPMEERYFSAQQPQQAAALILDTGAQPPCGFSY